MKNNTQHAAQLYSAILPFVKAFKASKDVIAPNAKQHIEHVVRNTTHWLSYYDFERAADAAASYQDDVSNGVKLLERAEQFIAGFEDDDAQEGVSELLGDIRNAIAQKQGGAQ